jgi:hypothetical protein
MEMLDEMRAGKTGVTVDTPKKILFGAGTIHKNLKYTENAWNFDESIAGSTKDGSKIEIVPKFKVIEPDGAHVNVKGLRKKIGETAKMDINFLEVTKEILKMAVIGKDGESEDSTYDMIESKADVTDDDYWENVAFVGETLGGKNIIVIMDNPLITNGLSQEGKNEEEVSNSYTFECNAELGENLETLPYRIYYPKTL